MSILVAKGSFEIEHWDENEQEDWQNGKLSRTLAKKKFVGEISGTATIEATMLRLQGDQEGVMAYIGIEQINCKIGDRTGTFILVHDAKADTNSRSSSLKILPGSGTGDFTGISGTGDISPDHDFTLTYELEAVTV
ncbi:MAG: DUF3224 domain-containing protein [Pseudomonadota bacterium]